MVAALIQCGKVTVLFIKYEFYLQHNFKRHVNVNLSSDIQDFGISGCIKSADSVRVNQWTRERSNNSSPELDGPGREGVASTMLLGSNGTSPPFVRAPAEDRSKYEKLIYDFEDVSSDDSHSSHTEIGNVL